jgi:integrase
VKTPEFPKEIKKGSVGVTIYETPTKGYPSYTLVYYQKGQRKRETNADYTAILNRANEVLKDLETGRIESIALSGSQRDAYSRAMQKLPPGVSLDVAVVHFAESYKILGGDLVIQASREYVKRHGIRLEPKTVPDVVTEFLATREQQSRSDRHLQTLKSHCDRFAKAMQRDIGLVTADDIDLFLNELTIGDTDKKISARTRDNFLGSLNNLFEFAKTRKYLPKDHDELDNVTRMSNDEDGPIEIYTVDEIKSLLAYANPQLVPFIAIGGFAGLRSSEIERLEWSDVRFDSDCIIVQKGKVKKRGKSRRMAPMLPNLKKILKSFTKEQGRVWPHSHPYLYELMRDSASKAGLTLKDNALRHSFVSYRVAATKNVSQVALEAGNSQQIIDSNYRELVTEADAHAWFSINRIPKKPKTNEHRTADASIRD